MAETLMLSCFVIESA